MNRVSYWERRMSTISSVQLNESARWAAMTRASAASSRKPCDAMRSVNASAGEVAALMMLL